MITKSFTLATPTAEVFDRLADLSAWSEWCGGMKRVRIDGAASGVGALRTVWVGTTRVQERFVVWEPGHRLTFTLTGSNTPGLHSMVEDWATAADPEDPARTVLTVRVGIEAIGILRPFPGPRPRHHVRTAQGGGGHRHPVPPPLNARTPGRQ